MKAAKTWVAAVGSVVTVLTAVLADNLLGADEIGQLVSAVITAGLTVFAVYRVPNRPA